MKPLKRLTIFLFIISITTSCRKDDDSDESIPPVVTVQQPYSFFVAGHSYGKPLINNVGFHPPFKAQFDLLKNNPRMQMGFLTGDIVIDATEQNWDEIDADIAELGIPIHIAVGNHEMIDRQLYQSRYGFTYGSFVQNSDLYIILDPNLDNWNISGHQLEYLRSTLKIFKKRVNNVFVFFHQVLWWDTNNIYSKVKLNSKQGRASSINFWTEVEPLFAAISNDVYMFAGDVGAWNNGSEFMYHKYANITLIASGMGAEVRDNIVIVNIEEDHSVNFQLVALNGNDINALGKLEDYVLPQ